MYGKLLDDSGAIQVCGKDIVVRNLWIWALDVFMHGGKRAYSSGSRKNPAGSESSTGSQPF
jgi:hypothetical protein